MPVTDLIVSFFFFNDTATTEIYTLSLHDALPISSRRVSGIRERQVCLFGLQILHIRFGDVTRSETVCAQRPQARRDRKSTRLNSSHLVISYAVFCLKKKKIYST